MIDFTAEAKEVNYTRDRVVHKESRLTGGQGEGNAIHVFCIGYIDSSNNYN